MNSILIVDDDVNLVKSLKESLLLLDSTYTIHTATNYSEASELINKNIYSVFFLDIQLSEDPKEKTGIDLGYLIREDKKNYDTPIIYVTTIDYKIQEALNNIHCYAFLTKPFEISDIENALKLLNKTTITSPYISYKDINGVFFQLPINDIVKATSKKHVTTIYSINAYFEVSRLNLDTLLQSLGDLFMKCNKSCIINTNYINNIDLTSLYVNVHGELLPIGRTYKNEFKGWINNATNKS